MVASALRPRRRWILMTAPWWDDSVRVGLVDGSPGSVWAEPGGGIGGQTASFQRGAGEPDPVRCRQVDRTAREVGDGDEVVAPAERDDVRAEVEPGERPRPELGAFAAQRAAPAR